MMKRKRYVTWGERAMSIALALAGVLIAALLVAPRTWDD